jgi:hypothetical protein
MTGTDLCVNMYKSVPVIFEPPCTLSHPHFKTLKLFKNVL